MGAGKGTAATPWWRTRVAIASGVAITVLAVAIPIASRWSRPLPPEPPVIPPSGSTSALRDKIARSISEQKFTDASTLIVENHEMLGTAAGELSGQLIEACKKQLANVNHSKASAADMVVAADRLINQAQPTDEKLAAAARLVKARAALRADDPSVAKSALEALRPEHLADMRDRATADILRALADEKTNADADKLDSLEAGSRNRLDPWELAQLRARIKSLRGGELERLRKEWAALLADLRGKADQGGASLAEVRKRLSELSTTNAEIWRHLTNAANAADYRAYDGLRLLATLRLDGLDEAEYVRALQDLNTRIRGDRSLEDAPALCKAALGRAIEMESSLTYLDAAKTAEARRLFALAHETAKFAAEQFAEHATAIAASIAEADKRRVDSAVAKLREMRDAANGAEGFAALRQFATGVADIVSKSSAAAILRTACVVECAIQEKSSPAPADRNLLRDRQSEATAEDKHYVAFVGAVARQDSLAGPLADAADATTAAYTEEGPYSKWREQSARKALAFELIKKAAAAHAKGELDKLATPYYEPGGENARKSAKWLVTASNLVAGDREPLGSRPFRDFRYLQILATFYASPEDKEIAKQVAAWTDPLVAANEQYDPPLQVLLVHARSHAALGNLSSTAAAYALLYDACRAAKASAPGPHEIDAHVLAPAVALLEDGDMPALDEHGKRAAARLFAVRGRYAHLHPSVQARVQAELKQATTSDVNVPKKAYEWFDAAVTLDPRRAEYYYGRGYACDLRHDLSYAERALRMEQNAAEAVAPGREPKDFPAADGLRGLALFYKSLTLADYDEKRAVLREADAAYRSSIAKCDAFRKSPAAAAYPDLDTDYPLLLVGRGFTLLHLANYVSDPAEVRKLLDESLQLALSVTNDAEGDEPKHRDGVHPEWAYHLAGNALEDYGWLLGKPEYYPLAIEQFDKAIAVAKMLDDPAGASLSQYHRGRCRYKLGSSYLAAARSPAAAQAGGSASKLRKLAEDALKNAEDELTAYLESVGVPATPTSSQPNITNADKIEPAAKAAEVAEADAFLAQIHVAYALSGLRESDQFTPCMNRFERAVQAAKRSANSPLDWQGLRLKQAGAALQLVEVAADGREKRSRLDAALKLAEDLAGDKNADPLIRVDAYRWVAETLESHLLFERGADGKAKISPATERRILAAIDSAVTLASQSGGRESVEAIRGVRGWYAALFALSVQSRGEKELNALVGAAEDCFAAVDRAVPLTANRLLRGGDLANIIGGLDAATVAYSRKPEYEKVRAKYVEKVIEVAGQTAAEYAQRFGASERIAYADRADRLLAVAAALAAREKTLAAKSKPLTDARPAIKTVAQQAQAERAADLWWDRKTTIESLLEPAK